MLGREGRKGLWGQDRRIRKGIAQRSERGFFLFVPSLGKRFRGHFLFSCLYFEGPLLISFGIFLLGSQTVCLFPPPSGYNVHWPVQKEGRRGREKRKEERPEKKQKFFCVCVLVVWVARGAGGAHTDFLLGTGEPPPLLLLEIFSPLPRFLLLLSWLFLFLFFLPFDLCSDFARQKKWEKLLEGGKGPFFFLEPRCPIDNKHGTREKSVSPFCFCWKKRYFAEKEG